MYINMIISYDIALMDTVFWLQESGETPFLGSLIQPRKYDPVHSSGV